MMSLEALEQKAVVTDLKKAECITALCQKQTPETILSIPEGE